MTRDNFIVKLNELLDSTHGNDIRSEVYRECARLADSGGLDIEGADDNYVAPKIALKVALENVAASVGLPDGYDKQIRNLRHF